MTPTQRTVSRRALLAAAGLLPLAGCAAENRTATGSTATTATATATASPSAAVPPSATATAAAAAARHDRLVELERRFGARLGVYALATGTNATIAHRADERFAFCSTFKALAVAAILHRHPLSYLDEKRLRFTEQDVAKTRDNSVITRERVATGMTLREVCDAAIVYSDGTAGNLLLRELGGSAGPIDGPAGPQQLTAYLRGIADPVTRSVRTEPKLWQDWMPGDERDTTSPRAIGADFRAVVIGDALPAQRRDFLRDLLVSADKTGNSRARIRAGVPKGWKVAEKTGTGLSYGLANDIGIVWPPNSPAIVIAIMSSMTARNAKADNALIAEAARYVAGTLAPGR